MSDILAKDRVLEPATMSSVYAKTLLSLMKLYPKVIEFEADLGRSLLGPDVLQRMRTEFPKQFVDCGIQECNMVGVAAGIAYDRASRTQEDFDTFLQEYVLDCQDHDSYLDKIGASRLLSLRVRPGLGYVPNLKRR